MAKWSAKDISHKNYTRVIKQTKLHAVHKRWQKTILEIWKLTMYGRMTGIE